MAVCKKRQQCYTNINSSPSAKTILANIKGLMLGAVAMQERQIGQDRGYPIMEATLYIYCDACGSFNIKTYIPFFKIIITLLLISAVVLIYRQVNDWRWYLALLPVLFFVLYSPWIWRDIYLRYRCRKCGNHHISPYNTMHYPPYDPSSVDVQDEQTQKRYIDESVLHFNQFLYKKSKIARHDT